MCNIFDYDDGDFCFSLSNNTAMDSDGNLMVRMSDNSALDLETGELHIVSNWNDDED